MSGHNHNQADQLDLDAFETHHLGVSAEWDGCPCFWGHHDDCPTLALVAEVRRLRAQVERVEATVPRAYPDGAIEYGGMVHYVDDDHKTHHPDVTCACSPTPIWVPRP